MPIVGQGMHSYYVNDTSYTATLNINYPGMISAHAQMFFLGGDEFHAKCGITQVVKSGKKAQDIWPPIGVFFGTNVLTVNFYALAWECGMTCSLVIDYWS